MSESGWVFISSERALIKELNHLFWFIILLSNGLQWRVCGGIWSVCPKTLTGILRPRGTMGKEWRLTGEGSWGWVWLTAISYLWNCVYFCLAAASFDCLAPRFVCNISCKFTSSATQQTGQRCSGYTVSSSYLWQAAHFFCCNCD